LAQQQRREAEERQLYKDAELAAKLAEEEVR